MHRGPSTRASLAGIAGLLLLLALAGCGRKSSPPPPTEAKPAAAPVAAAPAPAPPPPPPVVLGIGDLVVGTPFEGLKASRTFAQLRMADEPGGTSFAGRGMMGYLEDTRTDPSKGIHFCVQTAEVPGFGGRRPKGEHQAFFPTMLSRDPLAPPPTATPCAPPGETLWNEFAKVENAGLPRATGEAWGQPATIEIQVRGRKVDLIELQFMQPDAAALELIKSGFATTAGGLGDAATSGDCTLHAAAGGAKAYLVQRPLEVRVVFGQPAPASCSANPPAPGK